MFDERINVKKSIKKLISLLKQNSKTWGTKSISGTSISLILSTEMIILSINQKINSHIDKELL